MSAIFISYRRADTSGHALRIFEYLSQVFCAENVFLDVHTLQIGDLWEEELLDYLNKCQVMVALIGKRWLGDESPREKDYTLLEITKALDRGIPIFPVFVDGAEQPSDERSNELLRRLDLHQALWLDPRNYEVNQQQLQTLIKVIAASFKRKGKVFVERKFTLAGMLIAFEIFADEVKLGELRVNELKHFYVPLGKRTLKVKAPEGAFIAHEKALEVCVTSEDEPHFECGYEGWAQGKVYLRAVRTNEH